MKKLHNISHFCAASELKPEIARVLIKHDTEKETIETVATDSYRLVTIKYSYSDIHGINLIPTGLYDPKEFKKLCSIVNKKKITKDDQWEACKAFAQTVDKEFHHNSYPGYNLLLEKNDQAKTKMALISEKYMPEYLCDHIKMVVAVAEGKPVFDASQNNQFEHGVLEFKNDSARVLLMKLYK